MSSEPTAHVVFLALEAWGHTRPLCTLSLRLVQERQVYITFFTTPGFIKRIENELSRGFTAETKHLRHLIRIVALDLPEGFPLDPKLFKAYMDLFAAAYEKLANNEIVTCALTKKEIKTVVSPDAVIMDFFCTPALESVHKISKKAVKVYAWMSGQASCILYPYAPVHRGGRGDFRYKVTEEVAKTGRPIAEVAQEILMTPTGELVRTAGVPPMYDYEFSPQLIPFHGVQGTLNLLMHSFLDQCDGIILSTAQPYETEAIAEITDWFAETSRQVYTFGHLLPDTSTSAAQEETLSGRSEEIVRFLEKAIETNGPNSLLYISFGSVFWSTQPEKIWAFLDVVIERKIPFIFSHASPFAVIPDEIQAKVKAYGKGLLSNWSPQQTILAHPATGWFVTHGGQNSVIEALTLGVPMICWPFDADQPTNTARLSYILEVAYELFEVRTDPYGLKPVHRLGKAPIGTIQAVREEVHSVLEKAFGEDGARRRANMKKIQDAVVNTWSEDGPARRDLRRFVSTLPS